MSVGTPRTMTPIALHCPTVSGPGGATAEGGGDVVVGAVIVRGAVVVVRLGRAGVAAGADTG